LAETGRRIKELDNESSESDLLKKELEEKQKSKKLLEQEIDSYISVDKLLKKFRHKKETKDDLIDEYILSPSKALLKDEGLRIIEIMKNVIETSERGTEDEKKIERAREIIKNTDYLKERRGTVLALAKEIRQAETELEEKLKPIKDRSAELKSEKISLEQEIYQKRKLLDSTNQKILDMEKEIKLKKEKLDELVKELSPSPVEASNTA
jgi:uncharacterized coiled-coil DUF342 family protein